MAEKSRAEQDIDAWRARAEAFSDVMYGSGGVNPDGTAAEIDIHDLLGIRGRVIDVPAGGISDADREEGETVNSITMADLCTRWYEDDPFGEIELNHGRGYMVNRIRPLFGQLVPIAQVEAAVEPVNRAVASMREPIRTVTSLMLYGFSSQESRSDQPPTAEELAGRFGTSAETIQWITDIGMDLLAAHVELAVR
ncbi:MAG TPA: hypothetical protein VHI52_10705 [Verrucomicrobiae bacterium]|nr:hypothetical protein [Verrucomicrobiae bacterium]